MTAPVFEHTEIGGTSLSSRMVEFMDNLDRRWKFEDALNAHGVVEEFTANTIAEVGTGVAFLDSEDAMDGDSIEELLEPLLAFYEDQSKTDDRVDTVRHARKAIENAGRCFEVLSTLVSNLSSDTAYVDRMQRAIETLTPTEGEL